MRASRRDRVRSLPILATTAVLVLAKFGDSAAAATATYPTPDETRAEFEAVCRRLAERSLYFGDAVLDSLAARLAAGAPDRPTELLWRGQRGWELIRLGRLEEAIAELQGVVESATGVGPDAVRVEPDLKRRLRSTLAIAHFLLGEDQNCILRHSARSCILPIAGEAIHAEPRHARRAGDLYLEIARRFPGDHQARWLLNLSRMVSGDYPGGVPEALRLPPTSLAASTQAAGRTGFTAWRDVAMELGVAAFDLAGGAVMDDLDGDGLLDLVVSTSDPCGAMKAWRNDGNGGFEDVAKEWGLDGQLGGLNLVQADFDGDGALDLLVLRGAWLGRDGRIRNSLLRNDLAGETGRFVDVTAAAGLAYPAFPTQTAGWADYDGDGDLDLFVGNEATALSAEPLALFGAEGDPYPSQLFRNNGDATFTDVSRAAGLEHRKFTKGVTWGDYDDDGDPDLFLSVSGANSLYRNNGDGTFTDVSTAAGVAEPASLSFPTWFFDYDNDGDLDLFVADYSTPFERVSAHYLGETGGSDGGGHPLLYRNNGDGTFIEIATSAGVDRPALPMGANWGDLDNDGWPDFYLGTGLPDLESLMPNVMYRNLGDGRFADVTFAGGFGHLQKGHAVAFGDLDNDGDQDLYQQLGGAFPYDAYGNVLFENPTDGARWITLRLVGRKANYFGVGARVEVRVEEGEAVRSIHHLVGSGGSFGGSSLQAEIGLGRARAIEEIVIRWPGSGAVQRFGPVALDRVYRALEGAERLEPLAVKHLRLGDGHASHAH